MSELENMIFLGIFTILPLAIFGLVFGKKMISSRKSRNYLGDTKNRSSVWYALPIFSGVLGGIIAYGVIGHDDPQKARNCLLIGFIPTAGLLIILWITWFIF